MAPRGVGTMVSMIVVGRIIHRVDPRHLVVLGLCLTAYSLYVMTGFTPQMDSYLIIETGIVQGLGLGLVFVPLSTVAFATLDPRFRTDAASLFSLVRNLGSSIGISIVTVVLSRNIQINHAELSAAMTPFNQNLIEAMPGAAAGDPAALMKMDGMVNVQALMISYVNDFKLMMIVTLCALPLVFLLKKPNHAPAPAEAAVME
jgi:DHA2 family multidrug resistance protein